jgi:glycosyltransferase involved in cell wall biosynthesis
MKRYIKYPFRKIAQKILAHDLVDLRRRGSTWGGYTDDALQLAQIIDFSPDDLQKQQQHPERVAEAISDRVCNWYLPSFDNPFYGGIMTILRLADYLQRIHGIKQRFLICGSAKKEDVKANLIRAFDKLAEAEVLILDTPEAVINIPASDYSIATLWTTAYVLLGVSNTGYKFYMIQDFEPAFYPAGSTYAQAELSYRFGFYGIANTQSLKDIYENNYGGTAVVLKPNIDKTVFYPATEDRALATKRMFYYARPGTPRNGFELAAAALKLVKAKHGETVDIVCAGAGWNPADFGLNNVVRAVGMLPYAATGDLYRSCHVGFVMMMTKHPSYLPFELMACGSIVVTNHNEANTWLLKDGENCLLSPPSASCLAETLSFALENYEMLGAIRNHATVSILEGYGNWDNSFDNVSTYMFSPPSFNKSNKMSQFFALQQNHKSNLV